MKVHYKLRPSCWFMEVFGYVTHHPKAAVDMLSGASATASNEEPWILDARARGKLAGVALRRRSLLRRLKRFVLVRGRIALGLVT
jgi:hypothetical protein